jgi:hypothetical protein
VGENDRMIYSFQTVSRGRRQVLQVWVREVAGQTYRAVLCAETSGVTAPIRSVPAATRMAAGAEGVKLIRAVRRRHRWASIGRSVVAKLRA